MSFVERLMASRGQDVKKAFETELKYNGLPENLVHLVSVTMKKTDVGDDAIRIDASPLDKYLTEIEGVNDKHEVRGAKLRDKVESALKKTLDKLMDSLGTKYDQFVGPDSQQTGDGSVHKVSERSYKMELDYMPHNSSLIKGLINDKFSPGTNEPGRSLGR